MSIRDLSSFYAGREPYLKYPLEDRSITLAGAVTITNGAKITKGLVADTLTVSGASTFSSAVTCVQNFTCNTSSYFNSTLSLMNPGAGTDNQLTTDAGGALLIVATTASALPSAADENLSGLAIAWDVEPGAGLTDFINMAQGALGGFSFRTFNTTGIYQSLFSIVPKSLPVFTYGPVAYGHMIATGSLAFAYPSTTTASINLASGVYAYSINIPGTWTSAQAANATIQTTICNTNVGLGAVTCAIVVMPTMVGGFLNFQIQVINASHQAQECDFYYTVNCGNY